MEKQQISEKKTALSYVFSFIVGTIAVSLIPMGAYFVLAGENPDPIAAAVILGVIDCVAAWLGVMYAAGMTKKKYVITDVNSLVLTSYIHLSLITLVIMVPLIVLLGVLSGQESVPADPVTAQGISSLFGILWMVIFVVASRKYLK